MKLADAISHVDETLKACLITIQAETLSTLQATVEAQIQPILNKVSETQALIGVITGNTLVQIDTSSADAFLTSTDNNLALIKDGISSYISTP